MVLFRKGPQNPDSRESRDPNGLYGVLDVFGRGGFPPKAIRIQFLGNFLGLGGFGQGPGHPLLPLCGFHLRSVHAFLRQKLKIHDPPVKLAKIDAHRYG